MNLPSSIGGNVHYRNYALLLLICLVAYWPLTFGVFSVKNDAIHYFLPYRFHISEALRNGEWPFWSPYIYLGNPIYGDMQSGAWNPIVWIFSLFGRYDLTLFHFENLLYIFLGGLGMYKLVNHYVKHSQTALLIAVSYMLSGFMLGGQLINWLASAAFIPFVFLYYLRCGETKSYAYPVKTGLALFFLFTAGYPSFFIITCYLVLLLAVIRIVDHYKSNAGNWKRLVLQHLVIALVFVGLSAPAIISFYDLLPYYQRGSGATYTDVIQNSFEIKHLLSFFFPSTIKASDLVSSTDVTCRNMYIGLLILPLVIAFPPKINRRNILLISLALFSFLFSLGDLTPVRKICYTLIPLMDSFRHPSQMRLFIIFPLLLLAVPSLKRLLETVSPGQQSSRLKKILSGFGAVILIITIIAFFHSNILSYIKNLQLSGDGVKSILSQLTLNDVITVNGLIQIFFILCFAWWLKKSNRPVLFSLGWILNLFIMAQLVLPISFVGSTPPKTINAFIHASPKGFPVDSLQHSLAHNSVDVLDHYDKIALTGFYNKKITVSKVMNSPAFLREQEKFIADASLYNYVSAAPVVYIAGNVISPEEQGDIATIPSCYYAFLKQPGFNAYCDSNDKAFIKKLSANRFDISTTTSHEALLVLTQSFHHHWKAFVDNRPATIINANTAFMSVKVPAGMHSVIFKFCPGNTMKALWLQLITIIVLLASAIFLFIRARKR